MYCARALLEHDWPLTRFRDEFYMKSDRIKNPVKHAAREMELSPVQACGEELCFPTDVS